MKYINIKYLLVITIYCLLITACKRECQDERADNYGEGHRKDNCDYSYADNWYENIIVDSIIISGVNVEYEDETFIYTDAEYRNLENLYVPETRNSVTWRIDPDRYLIDTLSSISYYFGVPVPDDFEISLNKYHFDLEGEDPGEGLRISGDLDVFEERKINGVNYYFFEFHFRGIQNKSQITKDNFDSCRFFLYMNYGNYNLKVKYQINLLKLI